MACHSQIGKDNDPKRYFNGITKDEMKKYSMGIVDKAVKSARGLEKYTNQILKLYIFATEEERLQRIMTGRNLDYESALKVLGDEPSPGEGSSKITIIK